MVERDAPAVCGEAVDELQIAGIEDERAIARVERLEIAFRESPYSGIEHIGSGTHSEPTRPELPACGDAKCCYPDRVIALGRRAWLFAGSDRGGERAAAMYTLIATAKLNDINPQAWLAELLARIADHPASRLHELLPWHWKTSNHQAAAA